MKGLLVDSNIILDVFLDDPVWAEWSEAALSEYAHHTPLYINQIIYSEISIGFNKIEELEAALSKSGFQMLEIPKESLFLAGKAFLKYRKHKGAKKSPLPDFFTGAQAAVLDLLMKPCHKKQESLNHEGTKDTKEESTKGVGFSFAGKTANEKAAFLKTVARFSKNTLLTVLNLVTFVSLRRSPEASFLRPLMPTLWRQRHAG